jgi:hypothetical protein
MKWSAFFVLVLWTAMGHAQAQTEDPAVRLRDSLRVLEDHRASAVRTERHTNDVLKKCAAVVRESDVFTFVAGCRSLDSLVGHDQGLEALLTGGEANVRKLVEQRSRIDSIRIMLIRVDTTTAKGRKQGSASVKQLAKLQTGFDALVATVGDPLRAWLRQRTAAAESSIATARADQARLDREITDCQWKLDMEQVFVRAQRRLTTPPPATAVELAKAYAEVLEAADKDKLHGYDSLAAQAMRMAEGMLTKEIAARHREDMVLIPGGFSGPVADSASIGAGLRVSRVPVLQTAYLLHRITRGERGPAFTRALRAAIDRPAEAVPAESLARVASWCGARLLKPAEREYIECSAFRSLEDRKLYGVLVNFYDMQLNDRYAYLCWDLDPMDPGIVKELRERRDDIERRKDESETEAWRSGAVRNPKSFLVSAGAFGAGYFIQHTDPFTGSKMQLAGAGIGSGSLLAGVRYSIEGTELDGERYGYAGIQVTYLSTFNVGASQVQKAMNVPEDRAVRLKANGIEVSLVATLMHSFYMGVGMGHLNGTIELIREQKGTQPEEIRTEVIDGLPSHYLAPIGFIIRAGANFAFNFGAVVRWKGVFTQPSATIGLGITIDIPIVRMGV